MPIAPRAMASAFAVAAMLTHASATAQSGEPSPRLPDGARHTTPATLPPVQARPPASRPDAAPEVAVAVAATATAPGPRLRVEPADTFSGRPTGEAGPAPERWADVAVETVNGGAVRLPAGRGHAGPSVVRMQVLLNRAFFSPGMLDGRWGKNTQNAVAWLQAREGLPTTGAVDSATYARLMELAGAPDEVVRVHTLTDDDVAGPFVAIPADIYAHARLRCSCYESLAEKLTERFHTTEELLRKLNPGAELNDLQAGMTLNVPAVREPDARGAAPVAQLVVSGTGNYLHALDADGRLLYHFPATLGSTFDPSPQGDLIVRSVHPNPWWHYQPRLLAHVPNDRPNAMIPPGPNNAVGVVWMALSAPHYGIHGTRSPETIGYATSAGCVRLTNWDAAFLSVRLEPGTPVAFHGTREGAPAPSPAPREERPAPGLLGVRVDSAAAAAAAEPEPPPAAEPADTAPEPQAPAPPG
jgi:lipoprotein-anchoring transpeptidase ErfK/SrfK